MQRERDIALGKGLPSYTLYTEAVPVEARQRRKAEHPVVSMAVQLRRSGRSDELVDYLHVAHHSRRHFRSPHLSIPPSLLASLDARRPPTVVAVTASGSGMAWSSTGSGAFTCGTLRCPLQELEQLLWRRAPMERQHSKAHLSQAVIIITRVRGRAVGTPSRRSAGPGSGQLLTHCILTQLRFRSCEALVMVIFSIGQSTLVLRY